MVVNTMGKVKSRYPFWWLLLITIPMLLTGIALAYPSFGFPLVYAVCLMVAGGFGSLLGIVAILAWQ